MLKFNQLSLSQKRYVVGVLEIAPQHKKNTQVTLKECAAYYFELKDKRTGAKNEKIGYPNWLFNKNKVSRGVYQLPVPSAEELSDYQKELDSKLNPVAKAKAKVVKLQKAKTVKVKKETADEKAQKQLDTSRLQKIVDDSTPVDEDVEDFNQILRENGIEV